MEPKDKIKLDLNDWKILNQLDINCRQSDAEIGKKNRISKQVVNYRIKKLIKEEIITGFFPHINIAKLGYGAHKIYIKFKSINETTEKEIWDYLAKQDNIIWVVSCSGKWDLIFGIASKNIEEFNDILNNFIDNYSKFIQERAISVFNKATLHHRKWLLSNQQDIRWGLGGKIESLSIDNKDKSILLELNKNARLPIIEIAEKIKISSSLVIQRIKKLQKKEVIGAFRLGLDREKLGINYCKAFIFYQNKTSEEEEKLLKYCYLLKEILGVSQSVGPWDLELELEVKNYDDFHKIIKEMKNKFDIIASFDTCYIEKEVGSSFLPKSI